MDSEVVTHLMPFDPAFSSKAVMRLEGMSIDQIVDIKLKEINKPYLKKFIQVELLHPDRNLEPWEIPQDVWGHVKPKAQTLVVIRCLPRGGGGGGKGKNPLATILQVAVMAAAAWVSAGGLAPFFAVGATGPSALGFSLAAGNIGATLAAGAISLVGGLLISAFVKPPKPPSAAAADKAQYVLTGSTNRPNPYGSLPRIYGKVKVFPYLAAVPYSEAVGDKQFMRFLFSFGYGPLSISDIKIGKTALTEFNNVEYELRDYVTSSDYPDLYTNTHHIQRLNYKLNNSDDPFDVVTDLETNEIFIDFSFPIGLYGVSSKSGKKLTRAVTILVQYREKGATTWIDKTVVYKGSKATPRYETLRLALGKTKKQYELRIHRETTDTYSGNPTYWDCFLNSVRSVEYQRPTNKDGEVLLAVRMQATDQLNGTIEELNAIAEAWVPVYNGTTWVTQKSRHPAWCYADVFTGPASGDYDTTWLDADRLKEWADFMPDRTYDNVIETETSMFELAKDICSSGRARFDLNGTKFSVAIDKQQENFVQHFTPRNSANFTGVKVFKKLPHVLRVQFKNEAKGFIDDEILVYRDGYNRDNATIQEVLDLKQFGITNATLAFKDARFHFAQATLRPEMYSIETDIESLACRMGSLIAVANDVVRWGQDYARILSIDTEGDDIKYIELDKAVILEAGQQYNIRVRTKTNQTIIASVRGGQGETTRLELSPVINAAANNIDVDDLALFGLVNREMTRHIVTSIRRKNDIKATIEFVDEAPALYGTSYINDIPEFDTQSNRDANLLPPPYITDVKMNEVVEYENGIVISNVYAKAIVPDDVYISSFEWYLQNQDGVYELFNVTSNPMTLVERTPAIGESYEIKVLGVNSQGKKKTLAGATEFTLTTVGDVTVPPDVEYFTVEDLNNNTRRYWWDYDFSLPDLAGFELRYHHGLNDDWNSAIPVTNELLWQAPYEVQALGTGLKTVMIKAKDMSNNYSAGAGRIVLDFGEDTEQNIIDIVEHKPDGWIDGTIAGGSIDGDGNILATDTSGFIYAAGSAPMYSGNASEPIYGSSTGRFYYSGDQRMYSGNPAADMYVSSYSEVSYITEFTPQAGSLFQIEGDAVGSMKLEYRKKAGSPMYSGAGNPMYSGASLSSFYTNQTSQFIPFTRRVHVTHNEPYEVKISVPSGRTRGKLTKLNLAVDAEDIIEYINDYLVSSPAETWIDLTKEYSQIRNTRLTLQDNGSDAAYVKVLDKDSDNDRIKVGIYNSSNVLTTGLLDVKVQGI